MQPPAFLRLIGLCAAALACCHNAQAQSAYTSVYTDINEQTCRVVREGEEHTDSLCKGIAGYQLQERTLFGDAAVELAVRAPGGQRHPLEPLAPPPHDGLTTYRLGPKAEWRVDRASGKAKPVALIVRHTVIPDLMNPSKTVSYLVVSKITPQRICVTDIVPPIVNANARAAELADQAASKPCLSKD